ncbi:hypothetical protein [Streptomyces sp. NPDC088789]|uniref:hypothetical protein n=1 Tax=Streptomyces sp. NPDC088789 TaxID=3365899 RepID=UPI0037FAEDF1
MRSPAELDTVPWHSLTHAYGSAEDVPELIRAVYSEDAEVADEALTELFGTVHHQGSVYPASAPSVPFLAHAVLHAPGGRRQLLWLLAALAEHGREDREGARWSGGAVEAICEELCRVLPGLLPCLDDPEPEVRRAALHVVATVTPLLPHRTWGAALARVEAVHAGDPVPRVRADALVVLNRFGRVLEPLDSPLAEVRLAAARMTAERCGPPYAPEVVEILAEDGAEPDPVYADIHWPDGVPLEELLTGDPDAGLTVAGHWIAYDDPGGRGTRLAERIVETWRDREPEALELLLPALVERRGDPEGLGAALGVVVPWIGHVPQPAAELTDPLYELACAGEEVSDTALLGRGYPWAGLSNPALFALVRARDPRALELVPDHPDTRLLVLAAECFPAAADRLVPVIGRALRAGAGGPERVALVEALASFGPDAREAVPELLESLRTGRAATAAARVLGLCGAAAPGTVALLEEAALRADSSLALASTLARFRLTGDPEPALALLGELLCDGGGAAGHLGAAALLGAAAAPLLPLVEPWLTSWKREDRRAAAVAHHGITGSVERASRSSPTWWPRP